MDYAPDDYEELYYQQLEKVISIMQSAYSPKIRDYNVVDDDCVQLLDKNDKVIQIITSDQLTDFWDMVE